MAEKKSCEECAFRKKYDDNPNSFLGKIWRWHANWCPGWKSYMSSLSEEERNTLALKYSMTNFQSQN